MTHPRVVAASVIAFGLLLAPHCPRAVWREYEAGVAVGRHGACPRATHPVHFWTIVGVTALASLMGAGTVAVGIAAATAAG